MKTKIYNKLADRVKLVKKGKYYFVMTRPNKKNPWSESPSYSSIKKAIRSKHNQMHLAIRDTGYFVYFKERRIKKLNKFRRRMQAQK